jgi:hypothetical protein
MARWRWLRTRACITAEKGRGEEKGGDLATAVLGERLGFAGVLVGIKKGKEELTHLA